MREQIKAAKANDGRIIAVGTTVVKLWNHSCKKMALNQSMIRPIFLLLLVLIFDWLMQ